ncbi:hypothetical protein QR680_001477 [Steinernema hermaphroditum]|uniref:DRIM domain-containing protein n=1 Tax=Steinernema hermaphroditum TaxID=289476 RepID=A0AA39GYH0_9BILA|nr:hypothetical protein QR680_001477 [Steinernema hermaphroditum]
MKEKNTFKYVSFNEQIAKIGVDITKWRIALPTDAGDQETFFHEAISEYNDKDYGDHYKAFLDSVSSKNLRTYAQLLHNQKDVVTALLQQLSVERGSSYETLLELSLALARDLREDFYDYLWDFFDAIISILEVNWQSIDILQTGFRVLTTLFKIFWRKIVTELRRTFLRFIPLFGSKTQYIRRFSAESFAFFLRKSNSISKLIVFMIEKALDDGDRRLDNGIAFLIFNAVKGVSKQFVSRADELFKQILDVIVHLEDLHMRTAGTDILLEAMRLSVMYTRREFSYPITSVLLNSLLEYSTQGDSAANNVAALINVWIAERQGSVFSQHDELCQYLHKIAIALDHNLHITPSFLDLIAASLRMYNSESKSLSRVPETIKPFVDRASSSLSVAQVLQLFESLSCADVFDIWILPSMCHFTEECIKQQENEDVVLSFYAQFVSNRRPISVTTSTTSRDAVFSASLLPNLRRLVVQLLREGRNANPQHLLYCVVIWPWIWGNLGDAKQASDEVFALFNEIIMSSDVLSSDSMRLLAHCSYSISLVAPDLITRADSGKITQIISFAEGMEIDSFWNVVLSHIGLCQLKLHNDLQAGINEPPPLRTLWIGDESRKLNYSSCRIQLFKMLSRISFICKKKTGYLSPLILEVYKNEYCKFKAGSPTQNLLMNGEGVGCDKEAADVSNKLPAKLGSQKAFLALLELFANFTRPRKVHKEKLVFEMYMELLLSGIEEIQKAAIKCLFTYQEKFLLNYKENIENLTSPQKFNDEIVKFSIDEQNMTIAEADREKIMPYLMSALKNVLQVLRNMITVLDSDQRNQVFRIALACSHHVRLISENKLSIDPCFHGQIKDLRQTVNITLCQVFRTLQESVDEGCVDALLDAVLIPICVSRNNRPFTSFTEGIPEGVAKIFLSLTSVPTLFPLLNKKLHHENWEEIGNAEVTPIALLTAFLKCKSTSSSSALDVVEGIRNLLTLDCESKHRYEISCPGRLVELKHATYGTRLVITYIRPILEFLCETLSSEKCSSLPVYLDMLNRISEYVTDPSVCEVFCCTLLKLTKSGSAARKPDDVKNLLYAVAKLIVNVKEPFIFASEIFSLFPSTPAKEVRQALVSVVEHFSMNKNIEDKDIVKQISIIVQLESWDARRIDEPDFERRHTGFSALSSLCAIRDYKIETYCLEAYAAISCHYLKTGSDLSLKAAAISCLRDLTRYMALPQNKDLRLLSTVFIPECLNGLRHSNESVRLEFLTFLACLVRFCGYHSQLEKLQCLLNDDVELDFFAGPYLMNFTSRTSTLSDQALSLFAEVLKKASWAKYYHILNDYIKQLMNEQDKDKPIIRVIVKIIDSFHFDIKDVVLPDDFTTVTYVDKSDTAVENTNSDDDEADVATERKVAIIRKLVTGILPRLKKCIDGKDERHVAHKKAEKYYNEDDDVLRAPIALATVKLLKKLPTKILQQNLHGVVLKLCSLVLSRSYNVREVARKTMVSALKALGAEYLPFVIKEMKQIMNKGYQVHVMIYTVHVLISAMKDDLKAGGIDPCLLDIIEICKIDQFSDVTEEKNISGITHHVAEAKADKSCETYQFIGQFIGSASLNIVVEPLMHIIEERPQSKTVKTIGRLLESYSAGLCLNEGIDVPTLLVFVYQMLVRYTTAIEGREKSDDVEEKSLRPQSCLLLPKAPTRIGVIVKTSVKSKSFVFVEFALALFNAILKKTKSGFSSDQAVRHLDPFVPLVVCCLRLKHDRVVSGALRAIVAILEYPLPQLKLSITKIVETLFVLLADYAGMGRAGEKISILELTQNLFKAFTRIMRDSPIELFSTKRIQILLNYIETDITDPNKQATAFSLLKAILSKKIVDDKLPDLMRHLSEVSIMSHAANVRAQCRQILTFFVSTHPMGKDTAKFIEFFLAQLDYEHEDGRLSAIETLNLAYTTFVEDVVDKFALVSFIRLSMGLVNEESQNCRKYLALALRSLVQSCSEKARNDLYLAARDWLESDNDSSRYLAARSLVEFFESDSSALSSTVPELMAIISKTLTEELISSSSEDSTVALFKLASMMAVKCSAKFIDTVLCLDKCKNFWENFRHFAMCIESPDVQMVAAEFLGHLFSALTLKNSKISELPLSSSELSGFMFWQLKSKQLTTIQADQVIKNLVYLAKNTQIEDYYTFFANKLSQVCKYEINHIPDQAVRRVSVFKLAAAVFLHGDGPLIEEVISNIVPYLTRELNGKSDKHTEELKQMASEVCEILKTAVGEKRYTSLLAEAQRQLNMRTVERKQQRKELATVAPELAAERKLRKHKARIVAQKRRLEEFKPYRKAKRARREELED